MAINFNPRPGTVLYCNFEGYVIPEIVKNRPVIVVSPKYLNRKGLYTVVPMSTTIVDPSVKTIMHRV